MTLQEAESKLAELNEKIDTLLEERESILKEWDIAFHAENPENIKCIDENIGDVHNLYLVNGNSKMNVCHFGNYEMNVSINDFYKSLNNSMHILNIANKRNYEMPDYQRNLVYAKAIEIREEYQKKIDEEYKKLNKNIQNNKASTKPDWLLSYHISTKNYSFSKHITSSISHPQ